MPALIGHSPNRADGTPSEYNEVITDLSRLEASGMARDVGFDVSYHRTSTTTSDIPLTPPTPTP